MAWRRHKLAPVLMQQDAGLTNYRGATERDVHVLNRVLELG